MSGDPLSLPNHRPGVEIRHDPVKGRGVFALQALSPNTLIDVSPILLFPHPEYTLHGRHTLLHHYTYRWPGGFALALGLGSIFNHSHKPNVGFVRDTERAAIRYLTMKQVEVGEELCITYGKNLWFDYVQDDDLGESEPESFVCPDDMMKAEGMVLEDHSSMSGDRRSQEPAARMDHSRPSLSPGSARRQRYIPGHHGSRDQQDGRLEMQLDGMYSGDRLLDMELGGMHSRVDL